MVKDRSTVFAMALIAFAIMPYACNKGYINLYLNWDIAETIKMKAIEIMPEMVDPYLADISLETVKTGFNWFLIGIRGLGYASIVYTVAKKAASLGFIVALMADAPTLINRYLYNEGWDFNTNQLILMAVPVVVWLVCVILAAIVSKYKYRMAVVAVGAVLAYMGVFSYLNQRIYFNPQFAVLTGMLLLSSLAMEQMEL